ncbi:MAG: MFS transporter, partial [Gaiellaceae bacterium]
VWADRLPRQLVMLGSDAVRGSCQATIAVLLLTDQARLWHLLVLSSIYGSAEAFFRPAATGLLPSTVSTPRLQQANALMGVSNSVASLAGPAIAGVLVGLAGAGVAFAADAGTFVVSGVSLAMLRPRPSARPERRETFVAELAGGWREFTSHTWLWVIVVWASTYLFAVVAPMFVLGPLVAKESLGGAPAWGAIQSAFFAGGLAGGAIALRWRPARPILACTVSVFLVTPATALLALRAPVAAIAAAQLGAGIAMGLFGALWETTLQQHVAPEKLSRVSSYDWFGSIAFMPLGFAVAGPVAGAIGVSTTFWVSTAWVVLSTAAVLFVRDVRELRRLEPAPAADQFVTEPLTVP